VAYVSKRDGWLVAVTWASCIGVSVAVMTAVRDMDSGLGQGVSVALSVFFVALMLSVLYGTVYEFADDTLRISSGPFRFRVPLADVESIEPTRNPLSSPACSLDRLRIRYGKRSIMISPLDKRAFLDELATRCPGLRRIDC
jgi:hypothetical protein